MKSLLLASSVAFGLLLPSQHAPRTAGTAGPIVQRFLCERSYMNHAYGYRHSGIFVDRDGSIYEFRVEHTIPPQPRRTPDLTEAEMDDKYGTERRRIGTVPAVELRAMYQLIPAAARGRFSRTVSGGADRGGVVSSCYVFDTVTKRYREIELTVAGDWEYHNLAPEARTLATWLASLGWAGDKR